VSYSALDLPVVGLSRHTFRIGAPLTVFGECSKRILLWLTSNIRGLRVLVGIDTVIVVAECTTRLKYYFELWKDIFLKQGMIKDKVLLSALFLACPSTGHYPKPRQTLAAPLDRGRNRRDPKHLDRELV
jgi:hypothetical protein